MLGDSQSDLLERVADLTKQCRWTCVVDATAAERAREAERARLERRRLNGLLYGGRGGVGGGGGAWEGGGVAE